MKKQTGLMMVLSAFVVGALIFALRPAAFGQTANAKTASWVHGFNLAVRKPNELTTTKDTKRIGVEVFKDDNNGNLIYISESGSIAVVPGK